MQKTSSSYKIITFHQIYKGINKIVYIDKLIITQEVSINPAEVHSFSYRAQLSMGMAF
jgi:hypothetical protein